MESTVRTTASLAVPDPRADIVANARNIIMKTRASFEQIAQAARQGDADGVLAGARRARRRSGIR